MGVYHFMGLGKAVGAVTCAVDYVEKALDLINDGAPLSEVVKLFHGSGGISHSELDRGKIEALVFFTSEEVINRRLPAFVYSGNEHPGMVRDELVHVLRKVWKRADKDEGRKIYWCEVEINNYSDCFKKVVKVAQRFRPPGKQGKEIWCNLTGGSNTIGFALLAMAQLTAISSKLYHITQRREYSSEVRAPSHIDIRPKRDGYFNIFPFLKTEIDTVNFYEILMELPSNFSTLSTSELLSRLHGRGLPLPHELEKFRKQYMLKLYGLGYTDYNPASDANSITSHGLGFSANWSICKMRLPFGAN
jgi:hypothetical protein